MKTLCKILAVAVCVNMAAISSGQGLYADFNLGYALAAAPGVITYEESGSTIKTVAGSFGKGLNANLTIGYMFNENFGAELGVGGLFGSKYKGTESGTNYTADEEWKGSMIRVLPALKMTYGDNIKPYARMGLAFGLSPKVEKEYTEANTSPGFGYTGSGTYEFKEGLAMGCFGGIGADFKINDNMSFFAEINGTVMNWAPKKLVTTETYTSGGSSTTETETINFVDELTSSSPNTDQLKEYLPFSNTGIGVGLRFNF